MKNIQKQIVKIFSYFLISYGLMGLIGSVYGIYLVDSYFQSFGNIQVTGNTAFEVSNFSKSVETQFSLLSTTSGDASTSAKHAAATIRSVELNIVQAQGAANDASKTLKDAAPLFGTIGRTLDICFLSICPFSGISSFFLTEQSNFDSLSLKIDSLSTSFEQTSGNMEKNAQDMDKISGDLGSMSNQFNAISNSFDSLSQSAIFYLNSLSSMSSIIATAKFVLEVILIWVSILHLMFIGLGLTLVWLIKIMESKVGRRK